MHQNRINCQVLLVFFLSYQSSAVRMTIRWIVYSQKRVLSAVLAWPTAETPPPAMGRPDPDLDAVGVKVMAPRLGAQDQIRQACTLSIPDPHCGLIIQDMIGCALRRALDLISTRLAHLQFVAMNAPHPLPSPPTVP